MTRDGEPDIHIVHALYLIVCTSEVATVKGEAVIDIYKSEIVTTV